MSDILLLIGRSLRNALRQPATIIPNIAISVFFLFVYNSGLNSVAQLPGFQGTYLGFILPVSIVSAAVGGAGLAGQTLIKDIDNGYFTKLLLTPTRRLAVIWGPMIASAIILTAQVVLVMLLALAMGLKVAAGPAGFLLVVALAFLWGMAFAGYAAFMALKTKNAAAAQAATFAFFPLIFLSYTFVPKEYVTAGWLRGRGHDQPHDLRVRLDALPAEHGMERIFAGSRLRRDLRVRDADRHPRPLGGARRHQAGFLGRTRRRRLLNRPGPACGPAPPAL